jgi:hypothetical protein
MINHKSYTLQQALRKLREMKQSSDKDWWRSLEVCTSGEGDAAEPKLKCKHCNDLLTVSNPSQSGKSHLTVRACRGMKRIAAAEAAAAAEADATAERAKPGAGTGSVAGSAADVTGKGDSAAGGSADHGTVAAALGKRRRASGGMYATADQQDRFVRGMARFFFKNGIPLQLTEDPDLRAAVAHVGLLTPSRHDLSNKLLDAAYEEVQADQQAKLAAQHMVQLSTDGWRRKAAARGVPLINILALLPSGGSVFCKVVPAAGVVKDQHWIKERHLEWAALVTNGDLGRLVGMVMDNTKANM